MPQQVILNLDQLDDPLIGDGTSSFAGGMFSNEQANLIGENESSLLLNCDRERTGRITTRKGSVLLGGGPVPGGGPIIQGMAYYGVGAEGYLVVASGGKLWRESGASWVQIARGGVPDNADLEIIKIGNASAAYVVGTTIIGVSNLHGVVANGDVMMIRSDVGFEYTILSHSETGANTTSITIAAPGLATPLAASAFIYIKRLGAKVNNGPGYPGGTTTIAIDGIVGAPAANDIFIIPGERIFHTLTGTPTVTSLTFTPGLQAEYVASSDTDPIVFALGNNKLFWTSGIGSIYSWDGTYTADLSVQDFVDWVSGILAAPKDVKWIVWFQNRLIAAGSTDDDESLWFSDFGDPTHWDANFQEISIGGGESDRISVIIPWMDQNLVVGKEHAIYVVNMDPAQNPDPSDSTLLVASYGIKVITHFMGIGAPRSVAQVGGPGGDVFFIASDKQVRSLKRTIAAENQQEISLPVSYPIQDQLNRISVDFIANATGYYWNNKYMLACPIDGQEDPNILFVFDTSMPNGGNWSGVWQGWFPTAFTTKLLGEGRQALVIGQSNNMVLQWLEGIGADETDLDTYRDDASEIVTAVLTRGYTLGDFFNWKTGLACEFEFSDSLAFVNVTAQLNQLTQPGSVANFDTITFQPLVLPFMLPVVLPGASFRRQQYDLHRLGQWRELQLYIYSPAKKLSMRSIKIKGWIDTTQIQTLEATPFLNSPEPAMP
jgi:hypothetical protein